MSKLPCPPQHIAQVPESERDKCVPYTTLPSWCRVQTCGMGATEEHHIVRRSFTRSWGERDYALLFWKLTRIKVPLCAAHHRDCTENRSWFEYVPGEGFVFWAELTEGEVDRESPSRTVPRTDISPSVSPGQPCPYCGKRGDYPKKLTSPKSKPVSYRVPADEVEEHKRHLKEAAQHLGTYEQPHWQFWTYAFALAEALGNPAIEGAAKR